MGSSQLSVVNYNHVDACYLRVPVSVRSLSLNAAVHAFISLRFDYCNSLAYGISDNLLRRLQAAQNAASRLVTGSRRCDHITLVLQQNLSSLSWSTTR